MPGDTSSARQSVTTAAATKSNADSTPARFLAKLPIMLLQYSKKPNMIMKSYKGAIAASVLQREQAF